MTAILAQCQQTTGYVIKTTLYASPEPGRIVLPPRGQVSTTSHVGLAHTGDRISSSLCRIADSDREYLVKSHIKHDLSETNRN